MWYRMSFELFDSGRKRSYVNAVSGWDQVANGNLGRFA